MSLILALLKKSPIKELHEEVLQRWTIDFHEHHNTTWTSKVTNGVAIIGFDKSASAPRECLAHELLHLKVQSLGYRNLGIGFSLLDQTSAFTKLMEALDNELQHHIMFPHFCKMELNTKAFYADGDENAIPHLESQLATGFRNIVTLLPHFLTVLSPGGKIPGHKREELIEMFFGLDGGKHRDTLVEIREAILHWGKGSNYDVSTVVKRIFLAIDQPEARSTWFGHSDTDRPPNDGFFVDRSFEVVPPP